MTIDPDEEAGQSQEGDGTGAGVDETNARRLPTDVSELFDLLDEPGCPTPIRKQAFDALVRQLSRSAKVRSASGAEVLVAKVGLSSPFSVRWRLLELACAVPLPAGRSLLSHATSLHERDTQAAVFRLLRSEWVTKIGASEKVLLSSAERASHAPQPESVARLDFHPLLAVDDNGMWPRSGESVPETAPLILEQLDDRLLEFAELGMPMARELLARHGLLLVSKARGLEACPSGVLRIVKGVLIKAVAQLSDRLSGAKPLSVEQTSELLRLTRLVGRSPDFWELLDRPRAELLKHARDDETQAEVIALALSAMPSTSKHVVGALAGLPDVTLMALLDMALRQEQGALIARIQDIATERASGGRTSDHFWIRLSRIAPSTPRLERWWRTYIARYAPPHIKFEDTDTLNAVGLDWIRSTSSENLVGPLVFDRLESLPPIARLQGSAIALTRLRTLQIAERDRMTAYLKTRLRGYQGLVDKARKGVIDLVGTLPSSLVTSLADLERNVAADLADLARPFRESGPPTAIRPTRAGEVHDLVQSLFGLSKLREESAQAEAMERLRNHLGWVSSERREDLEAVAKVLAELPGEAAAVVSAVAIEFRPPALCSALPAAIKASAALRTTWRANLELRSDRVAEDLGFDEELARLSAEMLGEGIRRIQQAIVEARVDATWEPYSRRSVAARQELRTHLDHIQRGLAELSADLL